MEEQSDMQIVAKRLEHMEKALDRVDLAERPLMKYWPVGVTIVSLIIAGAVGLNEIDVLQEAIAQTQEEVKEIDAKERVIETELERVKTNQEHLQEDVSEIKDRVKDNSDKLDDILDELRDNT